MERQPDTHELNSRRSDGLEVFLLWHQTNNVLSIALTDYKQQPPFQAEFLVPNDKGNEAFHHPYAYMPEYLTQPVK
jgi:hypothetical protein